LQETFKPFKVSLVYESNKAKMKIPDSILSAAFELFMNFGVRSVSMDDIAQKLGISKKTIYASVQTKEDLILQVIGSFLKLEESNIRNITSASSNAIDEIININRHILSYLRVMKPSLIFDLKKYYPECWNMIEQTHLNFIREVIEKNILRGQSEGLYRHDLLPKVISKLFITKSLMIIDEKEFSLVRNDLYELIMQLEKYHLYGIVSPAGQEKLLHQYNSTPLQKISND